MYHKHVYQVVDFVFDSVARFDAADWYIIAAIACSFVEVEYFGEKRWCVGIDASQQFGFHFQEELVQQFKVGVVVLAAFQQQVEMAFNVGNNELPVVAIGAVEVINDDFYIKVSEQFFGKIFLVWKSV